jgi:hypothetical protein
MRAAQKAVRDAERRFPVRSKIAVPPEGWGSRLDQIIAWLDANCGVDGWISTPSSTRGVVNDALAIYFLDVTIAGAFVARWCAVQRGGVSGPRQRTEKPPSDVVRPDRPHHSAREHAGNLHDCIAHDLHQYYDTACEVAAI